MLRNGQTDVTKLIVAFRNLVKASVHKGRVFCAKRRSGDQSDRDFNATPPFSIYMVTNKPYVSHPSNRVFLAKPIVP